MASHEKLSIELVLRGSLQTSCDVRTPVSGTVPSGLVHLGRSHHTPKQMQDVPAQRRQGGGGEAAVRDGSEGCGAGSSDGHGSGGQGGGDVEQPLYQWHIRVVSLSSEVRSRGAGPRCDLARQPSTREHDAHTQYMREELRAQLERAAASARDGAASALPPYALLPKGRA
jgi:hypothetical protein